MKEYYDVKNSEAYYDVLDCLPPQQPDNDLYMKRYNFWRSLQKFPEDFLQEDFDF